MNEVVKLHHDVGDVVVKPTGRVNRKRLKKVILAALDEFAKERYVSAEVVHRSARRRYGEDYQTPGYHLRLYRLRQDLTQVALAKRLGVLQHHLSEMEHNKRPIGKVMARKLAQALDCDHRKFL